MRCLVTIHHYSVCKPPTSTTSAQKKSTFLSNLHRVFLCNIILAVRTTSFQSFLFHTSSVTFSLMSWIHRRRQWKEEEGLKPVWLEAFARLHRSETASGITALSECLLFKFDQRYSATDNGQVWGVHKGCRSYMTIYPTGCRHRCKVLVRISSSQLF